MRLLSLFFLTFRVQFYNHSALPTLAKSKTPKVRQNCFQSQNIPTKIVLPSREKIIVEKFLGMIDWSLKKIFPLKLRKLEGNLCFSQKVYLLVKYPVNIECTFCKPFYIFLSQVQNFWLKLQLLKKLSIFQNSIFRHIDNLEIWNSFLNNPANFSHRNSKNLRTPSETQYKKSFFLQNKLSFCILSSPQVENNNNNLAKLCIAKVPISSRS